jgi:hypothetical protein
MHSRIYYGDVLFSTKSATFHFWYIIAATIPAVRFLTQAEDAEPSNVNFLDREKFCISKLSNSFVFPPSCHRFKSAWFGLCGFLEMKKLLACGDQVRAPAACATMVHCERNADWFEDGTRAADTWCQAWGA